MEIIYTIAKWLAIAFLLTTAGAIAGWYSAKAYLEKHFHLPKRRSHGRHHHD